MTSTEPVDALPFLVHRDLRRTAESLPACDAIALVLTDGNEQRHLPLAPGACPVGRSWLADITLDDPTVSRRHATLVVDQEGLRVLDDCSTNGTFLNGERITATRVHDGDELQFGRVRVLVRAKRHVVVAAA